MSACPASPANWCRSPVNNAAATFRRASSRSPKRAPWRALACRWQSCPGILSAQQEPHNRRARIPAGLRRHVVHQKIIDCIPEADIHCVAVELVGRVGSGFLLRISRTAPKPHHNSILYICSNKIRSKVVDLGKFMGAKGELRELF